MQRDDSLLLDMFQAASRTKKMGFDEL